MKEIFDKMYIDTADSFYNICKNDLLNNKKRFIITANPESFMLCEKDEELMSALLSNESTVVPDGIGVVKASRILNYNIKERITGIDISYKLLEYANEYGLGLYLFGAKQEVIDKLTKVIESDYCNIKLLGSTNGYVKDKDIVFDEIVKLKPDIVLVALGIPAQEKLIYKHLNKFKKGIFLGVGGSFDVISGYKKRAPKIFIKTNTEWLYRIACEPKRLKRFWNNNVKFIFNVKKYK